MHSGTGSTKALASRALTSVAAVTRRFHPRGTERMLRQLHHPDARSWGIEAVAPLDGRRLKLHVNTKNFLEWQVFFYGMYEADVADVLRRHIRRGRHAIDVGANVGIHTLVMALAAAPGKIIACEPSSTLCARLRANMSLNGITNVAVRRIAVAAQPGRLALYPVESASAASHLTFDAPDVPMGRPRRVRAVTIDELVETEKLSGVDLIKIDTDGLEAAVLAGGRTVLRREHPALVFEYTADTWARAGYAWPAVTAELKAAGYTSVRRITRRGAQPVPASPPAFMNVLAT